MSESDAHWLDQWPWLSHIALGNWLVLRPQALQVGLDRLDRNGPLFLESLPVRDRPGSDGQVTVYPPSGSGWRGILYMYAGAATRVRRAVILSYSWRRSSTSAPGREIRVRHACAERFSRYSLARTLT